MPHLPFSYRPAPGAQQPEQPAGGMLAPLTPSELPLPPLADMPKPESKPPVRPTAPRYRTYRTKMLEEIDPITYEPDIDRLRERLLK